MGRHTGYQVLLPGLLLLVLLWTPLQAEYYEYVDENGVRIFTDDRSRAPAGTRVHKERFDHLDEAERELRLRQEQEEIQRRNEEVRERLRQYELREAAEQEKKAAAEREKRRAALTTPVVIARRQVLVPATFTQYGKSVTVTLLLDTGASITSVNQSVAQALDITTGKKSAAIVAGGGILRTRLITVDQVAVGPKSMTAKRIMVFPENGPDLGYQGLLGLDFLQNFSFTIDYGDQVIRWAE